MNAPDPTAHRRRSEADDRAWAAAEAAVATQVDGGHNMYFQVCGRWVHEDRLAIVVHEPQGHTRAWSHRQLDAASTVLAAELRVLGVRPGDRVASMVSRGASPWVTALAVWRTGAVLVPLFSGFGAGAVRDRVTESAAVVVVVEPAARGVVQHAVDGLLVHIIDAAPDDSTDDDTNGTAPGLEAPGAAVSAPDHALTAPDDPALLMFTSGTTGAAKACVIPHDGWLATVPFAQQVLGLAAGETVLTIADPGWSYGLITTGSTVLALGGRVVVVRGQFSEQTYVDVLAGGGVDVVTGPPTAYRRLVAAMADDERPVRVRLATSGGEPLDARTVSAWRELTGGRLVDGYGLTELGMVLADPDGSGRLVPVAGWHVDLVPVGGHGGMSLAVHRPAHTLTSSYAGRPDAWAARWTSEGWYLTEDLFTRQPDGSLLHRGRVDDIIVTAGYNVAAAEVEAAVLDLDDVLEVTVVPRPDTDRGAVVAALVVASPGADTGALLLAIQQVVRDRVGRHAYPRHVRFVDRLPRTASGKVSTYGARLAVKGGPA